MSTTWQVSLTDSLWPVVCKTAVHSGQRLVWPGLASLKLYWKPNSWFCPGTKIDFFEISLHWSTRRQRENETVLDISGSNFLTNLCLVGMRWPPTSGRRLGPGWRRWRQRATYLKRPLEVNGPRHRHSFFARWKTFKLCGRSAKVAKRDCLLNFTVLYHFSPFERFWSIGPSGILKMAHDSPKGQN